MMITARAILITVVLAPIQKVFLSTVCLIELLLKRNSFNRCMGEAYHGKLVVEKPIKKDAIKKRLKI